MGKGIALNMDGSYSVGVKLKRCWENMYAKIGVVLTAIYPETCPKGWK